MSSHTGKLEFVDQQMNTISVGSNIPAVYHSISLTVAAKISGLSIDEFKKRVGQLITITTDQMSMVIGVDFLTNDQLGSVPHQDVFPSDGADPPIFLEHPKV